MQNAVDYHSMYNDYWQRSDRVGSRSSDLRALAEVVASTNGYGNALDIGCGEGFFVSELLSKGIDAFGVDVSTVVIERANHKFPGRFFEGSALSLPFLDCQFDMVVSTDCLEHLAPADVPAALREIFRISSRYVFLQISTTIDRDGHWHLTVENRAWWEARCFEAGFRKHPLYYSANPYESLNNDGWQILILLEKVPEEALLSYNKSVHVEECLLNKDMLREIGRRSDAHCIRYHKAAEFIRPGDRVLDFACGLGYGSHILYAASQASSVLGVDLSDFGIAYANAHYGHIGTVEFRVGDAQMLDFLPDHSIDFITAFETIERVPDPIAYLRELKRVLKPAGRVMVCAPNNWVDETGKAPNPHHVHVYTWERLVAECGGIFLLEQGFLQTAGGAVKCHHAARKWVAVPVDPVPEEESEWVLLLCMADPITGVGVPYQETSWKIPTSPDFHVSAFARDYINPWLVKGMVAIGMRSRSIPLLTSMQEQVLASADPESVDYGAALCGRVYACLEVVEMPSETLSEIEAEIWRYAEIRHPSPHQLRWQVSLLFAGGELARRQGRTNDAISYYTECTNRNAAAYSPLLGNKVIDAFYWLSVFAICRHEKSVARAYLLQSINMAQQFVSGSWLNVVGEPEAPLPFGLAELAQLLDKASRAAYILSVLDREDNKWGRLFQESAGFFERQLADLDSRLCVSIKALNEVLGLAEEKERACQRLGEEVMNLDAHAQALAREVAARDADAQALAREVAARDADAQALAREVAARDANAQALAQELARMDAKAQELAAQVVKSDSLIAELSGEILLLNDQKRNLELELSSERSKGIFTRLMEIVGVHRGKW